MFSAFEEVGLENEKVKHGLFAFNAGQCMKLYPYQLCHPQAIKETGHRFWETVLAPGGGRSPLQVCTLSLPYTFVSLCV